MAKRTVNVLYDPLNAPSIVGVNLQNLDVQAGDQVYWEFPALPSGCVGGIHFETPLGPFYSMRLINSTLFEAKGNVGLPPNATPDPFRYRVQILDATGFRAVSQEPLPTITNLPQPKDTSPQVVIQIDASKKPTAQLHTVSLNIGDTATWHIFGLPADHFVTLFFEEGFDEDPLLGPFRSVLWTRAVMGEDADVIRGTAAGFGVGHPQLAQSINYQIQVRSADGTIVGHDDPVIDNLGEPVPTGGGST